MAVKKLYDLIYCDIPWEFKTYSDKGRTKSPPYPVMDLEQIMAIPIRPLLAKDAVLFMWCTYPHIFQAQPIMNEWGFRYATLGFEWVKLTKNDKLHFGTGYYTRANPEPCLLGIHGDPLRVHSRGERNLILELEAGLVDYVGAHSQKPERAYEIIEALFPQSHYPNRLELFASKYSIPLALKYGYEPIGFDVDGRDIRDVMKEMTE